MNRTTQADYADEVDSGLPWLQDTAAQHVWQSWEVAWRDVRILNSRNELVGVYNLTVHDLQIETNRVALRSMLLALAKMEDPEGNFLPDDWEKRYFNDTDVPNRGDFDQDGLDNFTEYAFGLDPTDGKRSLPVTVRTGSQAFFVEFRRRAGSVVDYAVEGSTNLVTWAKVTGSQRTQLLFDGTGTSLVTVTVPRSPDDRLRFFRVRATPRR